MSLLVRIHLFTSSSRPFTYNRRVDVELGLRSLPSAPTSPEASEREDVVAASAPSSDHVEDVTGPAYTLVSTPDPRLQSTLSTTVDVGSSPRLVQGAQIQHDEHPKVQIGDV